MNLTEQTNQICAGDYVLYEDKNHKLLVGKVTRIRLEIEGELMRSPQSVIMVTDMNSLSNAIKIKKGMPIDE